MEKLVLSVLNIPDSETINLVKLGVLSVEKGSILAFRERAKFKILLWNMDCKPFVR